jgi:cytochrome P450
MKPPVFDIGPLAFWRDPYPDLARMRAEAPICFVPQLNATLLTKRNDIATCEKNIEVFSSDQPGGLMTVLMGENMMRKDGDLHQLERKQAFPSLSPKTVKQVWTDMFVADTKLVLDDLESRDSCDLVTDYAMPVSGHALRRITGLTNVTPLDMDRASQGMIDGVSNYAGDSDVERHCQAMTAMLDQAIDERLPEVEMEPDMSMLSILTRSGQEMNSVRANIKLAISGGQNEPRDAIAGAVWALLTHPAQQEKALAGTVTWLQVFEEYARWVSPIGMSPRRVTKPFAWNGMDFEPESRAFLMFSSANRDEDIFDQPDIFNVGRNTAKAVSFGAGPHFCAGAAASRALIANVALPMLFERFPDIKLAGDVPFGGWAFRGPVKMPVSLKPHD